MAKASLVLFCGKEFASASANVSRRLALRQVACLTVEQELVSATVLESAFASVVLVPLMHRLDERVLDCGKVKLIHQWGVGLEGVDVARASGNGILVANTPSTLVTARSTAEMAVKLLLDLARPNDSFRGKWGEPRGRLLGELEIGVVGGVRGALGGQICDILTSGFHCRKLRRIGRGDDLAHSSAGLDVLILASPLTQETRGFVNAPVLAGLNPGAIVINVGRGPLVDPAALAEALRRDPEMRFGTDVWFQEPPSLQRELLGNAGQVLVTPHIGGLTHEAASLNDERCFNGIYNFLQHGQVPEFCVNAPPPLAPTSPQCRSQVHPAASLHSQRPSPQTIQRVAAELGASFASSRVITNPTELLRRGTDESLHEPIAPDLAFIPHTVQEVVRCVHVCRRHSFPIIPFGAGTCLEGGVAAPLGGLCIDTSAMNQVLEINAQDFDCLVQPGVTRLQLAEALKHTGLFFPVDPGANATLGGMTATRASGTTAVRYGTMRDRVMGVQVVLPNGSIVDTTKVRVVKSSAGLDLTSLFVGSEGTLGVITAVRLRLSPVAESIRSAVVQFSNAESAVNTVIALKQLGVPVARAEFLDATTMRAVRAAGFESTDVPTLFLEFHGTAQSVQEQCSTTRQVCQDLDGFIHFAHSGDEKERAELWKSRHNAYYSVLKLRAGEGAVGTKGWPTDVCVPLSNLYQCMLETWQDIAQHDLVAPIFGHVGDGNFHCILLYNKQIDGEQGLAKLQAFNDRLVLRALRLGGTCTGEHGLGYGKKSWLDVEHGQPTADFMRQLKRSVDPQNLMNPFKVF